MEDDATMPGESDFFLFDYNDMEGGVDGNSNDDNDTSPSPSNDSSEGRQAQGVSDSAVEKGIEAQQLFDQLRCGWESNNDNHNNNFLLSSQGEGSHSHCFDFLTPDHHLVHRVYQQLKRHVRRFPGWALQRREATPVEREAYRVKRKSKVYFVQAVYNAPRENEGQAGSSFATGLRVPRSTHEAFIGGGTTTSSSSPAFAKSSNSAFFSPARIRLHDSTNDANMSQGDGGRRQNVSKTIVPTARVVDDNNVVRGQTDPVHSFVPVLATPASERQAKDAVISSPALKSPKPTYHLPEQSLFSGFSDDVLQAAPQRQLPGGFVYGDVVSVFGGPPTAMVLERASDAFTDAADAPNHQFYNDDDLIVLTNDQQRLIVGIHELTIVKKMPRWKSQEELGTNNYNNDDAVAAAFTSPPRQLPDGRANLPM